MNKADKLYETLHEMTDKMSVQENLIKIIENKDTINSPTFHSDLFNKKIANFATNVEGPTLQKFEEYKKILIICLPSQLIRLKLSR